MEKKYAYDLHAEHKEFTNKLAFYKDEIKIMQSRIEEIASKNTSKEVLAFVDHFQNQLIIQKNNIDELNHRINEHEQYIQKNIAENPNSADHRKLNDHPKMR